MATFSMGDTPGAPGVYINEKAGISAAASIASFSTVYMLVEAPESAPVTVFPFNTPVPVTSLADYKVLVGGSVPTDRIPLLSYNCVNEFFQNAQVGDLRVVRVGTPNSIVEVEFFPSAAKASAAALPSALMAGDKVYVQMILNGTRLVAGDGSTGYTASGEWLGVPVIIPVNYVAGDEVNNRKISKAIADAVAAAIESNPSIRTSVYVRSFGLVNDVDPASNSQNGYVSIAGATFDSNVTVITKTEPVSGTFAFTQNTYDIQNVNGLQADATRVPQDYIQCIDTAFDGQQDQGYLVTPTAYAQFDAAGRSSVGAKAASHCASNNYKWMALADPGPFLVTDINKYDNYVPHQAAADLIQGLKYLVDNAIYEWTGDSVTFSRLDYQTIVGGGSPKVGIQQSTNSNIAPDVKVGILDRGEYTIYAPLAAGSNGRLTVDSNAYWPVDFQIQEVTLTVADSTSPFAAYQGTVYVVAPPYNSNLSGEYPMNTVFLAQTSTAAVSVFNAVVAAGGSQFVVSLPAGAINIAQSTNGVQSATISYAAPAYDLPVTINGQTSNLVQNIRSRAHGVNTQHLPATLQDPTSTFVLGMFNRTFLNPSISIIAGTNQNATITCVAHGLTDGVKVFFTAPIVTSSGFFLFKASTKTVLNPYYVKVLTANTFVLASSATNFAAGSYVKVPSSDPVATATPVISYSTVLAALEGSTQLNESGTFPLIRGRKYAFDSSAIYNQASSATAAPVASNANPQLAINISQSSTVLGEGTVAPYGETVDAGWLPKLELLEPAVGNTSLAKLYSNYGAISSIAPKFVTRNGNGQATAIAFTGGGDLLPGAQGFWNVEGEAVMFLPPVWVEDALAAGATMTWDWRKGGLVISGTTNLQGVILGTTFAVADGDVIDVVWTITDTLLNSITDNTQNTPALLSYATFSALGYNLAGNTQASVAGYTSPWVTGRTVAFTAATLNATAVLPTAPTVINTALKSYLGVTLFDAGAVSNASAQLPTSTNGTYVAVDTAFTFGLNTVVNRVQSYGAVGPLQANAQSDWANALVATNPAWTIATTANNVTNSGAQNFFAVPTVAQEFMTESYLVPSSAIAGGSYNATTSLVGATTTYSVAAGLTVGSAAPTSQSALAALNGVYLTVTGGPGTVPGGTAVINAGDTIVVYNDNGVYSWVVVNAGEDLSTYAVPLYGSQTTFTYTTQVTPPISLWRFDAVTSTELIDQALRGVGTNGVPQALFIEAGVDNVNRLYADSQNYFNAFGFIAYYGSYILNASGQYIPPSPYVTGVALRRYRAEGFQFPPAGVKFQLIDAVGVQIPINSSQQNLLNPDGCNAIRTLPGYPQTAVFIWGGRTRVNSADAQQKLYQFVNTRVIMNVVYGSLRTAFDSQIFNVIDGFGVVYNQIISVGNSILNQLYVKGALFGARPSDAFQVICDSRINSAESLENGIVNAKVFVTPVPTLERIQIDLIRVAIGQMQNELDIQGLGQNNG